MSEEELIDYVMNIDGILQEIEDALDLKKYKKAQDKVKEARALIDDLRQEDCADDARDVGSKIINKLK